MREFGNEPDEAASFKFKSERLDPRDASPTMRFNAGETLGDKFRGISFDVWSSTKDGYGFRLDEMGAQKLSSPPEGLNAIRSAIADFVQKGKIVFDGAFGRYLVTGSSNKDPRTFLQEVLLPAAEQKRSVM